MDINMLVPLSKTSLGNRHVVNMTCCYLKLTCSIGAGKITSTHLTTIILDNGILPYGISNYVLTDNGPQLVRKFFMALYLFLGVKHLTTTAFHRHTNGQVELLNCALVARLRNFVSERHEDWNTYIQLLACLTTCRHLEQQKHPLQCDITA